MREKKNIWQPKCAIRQPMCAIHIIVEVCQRHTSGSKRARWELMCAIYGNSRLMKRRTQKNDWHTSEPMWAKRVYTSRCGTFHCVVWRRRKAPYFATESMMMVIIYRLIILRILVEEYVAKLTSKILLMKRWPRPRTAKIILLHRGIYLFILCTSEFGDELGREGITLVKPINRYKKRRV
jgi:hypothetical protein